MCRIQQSPSGLPEKVAILKYIEYLEGVVDELDITSS
jgi:hypothetical protein